MRGLPETIAYMADMGKQYGMSWMQWHGREKKSF